MSRIPNSANLAAPLAAKPVSLIESEIRTLFDQGERLHKMTLELGERLGPVLHMPAPSTILSTDRPDPDVPLVEQLVKINNDQQWAIRTLTSILERLDLP